jgi:acyl carrier protein
MTAAELEQRLLKFTRERLAAPEVASLITVDTRLFEDRVIDSLKVLELIAFVQSVLGRKIPDKHIVLANFRSIATIARVFTSDDSITARVSARRSRSISRSNGHRANGTSAVQELIARGDLELTAAGGLLLRGAPASLRQHLDRTVRGWALDTGATEEDFPSEIPVATLERAGFISAFPQKLVRTIGSARSGQIAGVVESAKPPAVCYHHYPSFSNRTLGDRGSIVTALGRCHRNEHDPTSLHPEERLAAFTMREIIAVGNDRLVERLRTSWMNRVSLWLKELELDGFIETATDPFFTTEAEGRGRMLMQQLLPLKYELRLRVGADGRSIAAASFNNHQQHFARAFSIRLQSGEYAHSGCVAFGWERWIIAFVNQHGPNEANWPVALESTNVTALV